MCTATNVVTNDNTFQVYVNGTQYEMSFVKWPQSLDGPTLPGKLTFSESRNSTYLHNFKSVMPPGSSHYLIKPSKAKNYTCTRLMFQEAKLCESKHIIP